MRIGPGALENVVFLGYPFANRDGSAGIKWVGTAFYVEVLSRRCVLNWTYLVTCRHVVQDLGDHKWLVFSNRQGGNVDAWPYGGPEGSHPPEWLYHPDPNDDVDLAVARLDTPKGADVYQLPDPFLLDRSELVATREDDEVRDGQIDMLMESDPDLFDDVRMRLKRFHVGNEIAMVGMFVPYTDTARIHPIVRIGTIALIPWKDERVPVEDERRMELFLIEARSIGGISGSPVIAWSGPQFSSEMRLLGIARHHWDLPPSEKNTFGGIEVDIADSPNGETSRGGVNYGIATVVPAWKLREILDRPEFADKREAEEDRYMSGATNVQD